MSGGTPYIGSTISLISKAEIRYEGILWSIDTKDSTVTLANVRSYGTEDRATEKRVGPRSEVYEYIVFRGSDIKDLHVSKAPKHINTVNQDPSILQQGAVGTGFSHFPSPSPYASGFGNFTHPYGYGGQPTAYAPAHQPVIPPGRAGSPMGVPLIQSRTPSPPVNISPIGSVTRTLESETQTPQPPIQKSTQTGKPRRRSGSRRNSAETNQNGPIKQADDKQERDEAPKNQKANETSQNKTKGPLGQKNDSQQNAKKGKSIKFNGEFDFVSSNARFDKEKIESELKSEIEKMKLSAQDEEVVVENEVEVESPAGDGVYYDKDKSFFDFISSDPLQSEQGKRPGWQEERKLNVETFGVTGSYNRGYGRGRGWRGRGGSRGRGRGRGGFRGKNDNANRDNDRNQQNRTFNRGGRGSYRGYRGNRGGWRTNENQSLNGERIKSEPAESFN